VEVFLPEVINSCFETHPAPVSESNGFGRSLFTPNLLTFALTLSLLGRCYAVAVIYPVCETFCQHPSPSSAYTHTMISQSGKMASKAGNMRIIRVSTISLKQRHLAHRLQDITDVQKGSNLCETPIITGGMTCTDIS